MPRLTSTPSHVNTPDNEKVLSRDKFVNYVAAQDICGLLALPVVARQPVIRRDTVSCDPATIFLLRRNRGASGSSTGHRRSEWARRA